MHRRQFLTRVAGASLLASAPVARAEDSEQKPAKDEVRNIGSRRELFVDDWLLDGRREVELRLHSPTRRESVLQIDQPWEKIWAEISPEERKAQIAAGRWTGATPIGYSTVLKDNDLYRLYYSWDRGSKAESMTGYAESKDGIHWTKPKLGIIEFRGSKDNNLVWVGGSIGATFAPFRDTNPQARPEERYKSMAGIPPVMLASPDGLNWRQATEAPVLSGAQFDSQNVAFWDGEQRRYVAYYRDSARLPDGKPVIVGRERLRTFKRATSEDSRKWTSPGEYLDYGDAPQEHFYTVGVLPYFRAPHLYLGFPKRFEPQRKVVAAHPYPGLSEIAFISSRDGQHWDRRFREAFVRPGLDQGNWTERNLIPAWGLVQTGPAEMSLYWGEHFRSETNHLQRGSLRLDGFVSLHAGAAGGDALTRPLTFAGKRLLLNYSTSAFGGVRVEVLQPSGEPIAGLSGENATELYGDAVEGEYRWFAGADLGTWSEKPVRLRIHLRDADLYALQFTT